MRERRTLFWSATMIAFLVLAGCRDERAAEARVRSAAAPKVLVSSRELASGEAGRFASLASSLPEGPVTVVVDQDLQQTGSFVPAPPGFVQLRAPGRQREILSVGGVSRDREHMAFVVEEGPDRPARLVLTRRQAPDRWEPVARSGPLDDFADWPALANDGQTILLWKGAELLRFRCRGEVMESESLASGAAKYWPAISPDGQRWAARQVTVDAEGRPVIRLLVEGALLHPKFRASTPVFSFDGQHWACPGRFDGADWLLVEGLDPQGPFDRLEGPLPDPRTGGLLAQGFVGARIFEISTSRP